MTASYISGWMEWVNSLRTELAEERKEVSRLREENRKLQEGWKESRTKILTMHKENVILSRELNELKKKHGYT